MNKLFELLINSKGFLAFSGLASIVSFIFTFIFKDNTLLWIILSILILILILVACLISYNFKLVGKLDSINMHIIGETIELENDTEDDLYTNKDYSVIVLSSNLSPDKINEQHRAILEIRLPSYLEISIDFTNGIRREESNIDLYKISVPLTKEITYVRLKSFIVSSEKYEEFMMSSKRIDIKLSSDLINSDKSDYISIELI